MKEAFDDIRTDPSGNIIIHGHLFAIDLFNEGYNETINGARIKDEFLKINLVCMDNAINSDGYAIGKWQMIFRQGYKMSDVFDRLPYGIIDKTITGLGATTLELFSEVRNSIIVVPTKALAYNKNKMANSKKQEPYCLYVGSAIGDIKKDSNIDIVKEYLQSRANKVKKFLVVADSLPLLLDFLTECGENVFQEYFLMVDEIDTMQDDSAYRPKLEVVIDNYFRFKYNLRAAVSATIRKFSDPRLNKESRLRIEWEVQPKRKINAIHTNYVDDVAWNIINAYIESGNDKILVAYNSLDGIINIIKHLRVTPDKCGILCSERSNAKVRSYISEATDAIDAKGHLNKRVTFMTCAYFAGIDIFDKCHLISISTKFQPFTYLSLNKLTQIAGRLRNGTLSETIVYDTCVEKSNQGTPKKYEENLIIKASKYSELLNASIALAAKDETLNPLVEFLYSYVDFAQKSKSTDTSYPLNIVRQNSLDDRFVPAYLNIDALVETLRLRTILYRDKHTLVKTLKRAGHTISTCLDAMLPESIHDTSTIYCIKNVNKVRLQESFDRLFEKLIEWHKHGRNPYKLKELKRNTDKRLQDNVIDVFEIYSEYMDCEELLGGLKESFSHDRKLRNFVNSVVYHILPPNHPFKAALTLSFGIDMATYTGRKSFTKQERHEILKAQLRTICKYDYALSSSVLSDLLNSFYSWARSAKGDRIKGINPCCFSTLIKMLSVQTNLIDLFIFPK